MNRIVLTFFLCMITWLGFAETRRYYCEVKGIEKELGNGLKIIFDFGDVQMSFILTFALHESGREVECVRFADVDVTPTIFEKIKGVKPHIEKKLQVKRKIETYKRWVLTEID